MGLHLLGSKTVAFVGGILAGRLYKSGFINKVVNSALNGVENVLGSEPVQKIRKVESEEKKNTRKPAAKS